MKLKTSAWEKAKEITMKFEGTGYGTIAGNFDGQILSMGYLQWNLGQGTLQPLLKKFFGKYPDLTEKLGLNEFKDALDSGAVKKYVPGFINGSKIGEPLRSALVNLCSTGEFQKIQDDAASWYRNKAIAMCKKFNLTTDRAFALFFDIAVQNGSVRLFKLTKTDYLGRLGEIAERVVKASASRWQTDVRSRKTAIVKGSGYVHSRNCQFTFDDQDAFEHELSWQEVVEVLRDKGCISVPDYWLGINADSHAEGKYVHDLILNFVAMFKVVPDYSSAVDVLVDMKISKSGGYWKKIEGKKASGKYTRNLLSAMAKVLKNTENVVSPLRQDSVCVIEQPQEALSEGQNLAETDIPLGRRMRRIQRRQNRRRRAAGI